MFPMVRLVRSRNRKADDLMSFSVRKLFLSLKIARIYRLERFRVNFIEQLAANSSSGGTKYRIYLFKTLRPSRNILSERFVIFKMWKIYFR